MKRALVILGLCGATWTTGALAQSSPEKTAAAQALYDAGMTALDAKDYAKACPKFEEASRLVPEGIGVKLMLGQCYEGAGRLASAWATYRVVESEAARLKQEERRSKAQKRIEAIEPRLSKLTIDVPPEIASAPNLKVLRGGVEVAAALFGTALPVDAGDLVVTARSSKGSFEKRVSLKEGQQVSVTVTFSTERKDDPPVVVPEPAPKAKSRGLDAMAIGGIVTGAIGVGLLGAGIGLGVKALMDESAANDICPEEFCNSQEAVDLSNQANTFSIVGWVGIGLGVAATGAGIALVVISLKRAPKADAAEAPTTSELVIAPSALQYRLRF